MVLFFVILFFAVIGITIFLGIFIGRKNWFNLNHIDDPDKEVYLTFKDFENFYNINPNRYMIDYDSDGDIKTLIITENGYKKFKIKFKLFSFIKFFYWCKYIDKHKHNENMKKVLELVQKDIDNIRRQSEKEIREAKKITNEIGGRLSRDCHKCVYEVGCHGNPVNCKSYKRDAPDGGYYG